MPETRLINEIIVGKRHRKDTGSIKELAESIQRVGLLQPVVIRPDNKLVAGERRLLACAWINWTEIPVYVVDGLDDICKALEAERDENTCRLEMAPSEKVSLTEDLLEKEKEKAKKTAREAQSKGGKEAAKGKDNQRPAKSSVNNRRHDSSQNNGDHNRNSAAAKAAKASGMSTSTYLKTKEVVEAAKQDPDTFGPIQAEMDRTGKVDPAFKKVKEIQHPTPPPEPPRYPHSERLNRWLLMVIGEYTSLRTEPGGLAKLLADRKKWDWQKVREVILPSLDDLLHSLDEVRKEITDALE